MSILKWPPFRPEKKDGAESGKDGSAPESAPLQEVIFRPKPEETLPVDALVEKAREGESFAAVEELDSYFDKWMGYATDRNLLYGSPARTAMANARRDIIKLGKDGKFDEMRAKLEELSGPLAQKLEEEGEKTMLRIQNRKEADHAERRQEFEQTMGQVIDLDAERDARKGKKDKKEKKEKSEENADEESDVLVLTKEQAKDAEKFRDAEREFKAEKFARKYGIEGERDALLTAEREYADALREHHAGKFTIKFRGDAATKEQREKLEAALTNWREALARAGEEAGHKGEKTDKVAARFISARDTMARMARVRQGAVEEGMDARSKSRWGRLDAAVNKFSLMVAKKAMSGYMTASEKVGSFVAGKLIEKFVDKEADPEKYQRASRIIGGALLSSAIFAPAGAFTAGVAGIGALTWRIGKGLGMGFGGSAIVGKYAGKGHELKHGKAEDRLAKHLDSRKELHDVLRGKKGSFESLDPKELQEAFKLSNKKEFQKSEDKHAATKAQMEMAAVILVGGVTSFGFAHLPSVHHALETVQGGHVPDGPGHGPQVPTGPATHHGPTHNGPVHHGPVRHDAVHQGLKAPAASHAAPPHAKIPEAVHSDAHVDYVHVDSVSVGGKVNDADKLFGHFVDKVHHQFPDPKTAPPALRTLLEHYKQDPNGMKAEDVLTRFLHLQDGVSVRVHAGDTVSFENGKVMFQGHELIDNKGTVHDIHAIKQEAHVNHPHPHPRAHHVPAHPHTEAPHVATPPHPHTPEPHKIERVHPVPAAEHEHPAQPYPGHEAQIHRVHPTERPHVQRVHSDNISNPIVPETHEPAPHVPEHHPVVHSPEESSNVPPPAHNDNAQHVEPRHDASPAAVEHVLNQNGFDLMRPNVGADSHGNLFSHVPRTGNVEQDNELAYQTALKYATEHHDSPVYFADEARNALGQSKFTVYALKFDPARNQVWNFIPDHAHPFVMPDVPKDAEFHKPKP